MPFGLPWPVPSPASSSGPAPDARRPTPAGRQRYRVSAVDVAEQHEAETVYRLRVRPHDKTEPEYTLLISQPAGKTGVPHDVGATVEIDPRLLAPA